MQNDFTLDLMDQTTKRRLFRVVVIVVVLLNIGYVSMSYAASTGIGEYELQQQVTAPRDGITVVTTQSFAKNIRNAEIVAFAPNGTILYYNDSFNNYLDVDPSPIGRSTVEFVATGCSTINSICVDHTIVTIKRVNLTNQ